MPQADGACYRCREMQADHLTSSIALERTHARFPSRYMHRYPFRRAHQLDHNILCDLSPSNLAADLFSDRLAFALFASA